MKRILLLLSCIMLASCGGNSCSTPSSQPASLSGADSQASVVSIYEDNSTISSESPSRPSVDSEEASAEPTIDSEKASLDSVVDSEKPIATTLTLLPEHFPSQTGNGYPADQDIEVDGAIFSISDVCLGNWKKDKKAEAIAAIQMKRGSGLIEGKTPIKGTLTIKLLPNSFHDYQQDIDVDAAIAPTVEIASSLEGEKTKITCVESEGEIGKVFTYNSVSEPSYFTISNDSSYAQYATEITWAE